jgi:hypothetical protein
MSFFDCPEAPDLLGQSLDLLSSPHNLEMSENKDGIPLRIPARKKAASIGRKAE